MVFEAQELSHFEICPRLPQIERIYEPPRWPIREAMKQHLEQGVRAIFYGNHSPADMRKRFIEEAAVPGFIYPSHAEPFILANDHGDWLEGALEVIKAEHGPMQILPIYEVGPYRIHIEGWLSENDTVHIFRAKANLGERTMFWPEIAALALTGKSVVIENFRLPSVRDGRLSSPLNMAYRHPTVNVNLRIARLYDETEFGKGWKKVGRWEVSPKMEWTEWKLGIEKDRCIDQIREVVTASPILDVEQEKIIYDLEHMCAVMEKPHIWPRFRETCQSCIFSRLCHGDEESRNLYKVANQEALEQYEKKLKISLTGG